MDALGLEGRRTHVVHDKVGAVEEERTRGGAGRGGECDAEARRVPRGLVYLDLRSRSVDDLVERGE